MPTFEGLGPTSSAEDVRAAVAANRLWYHAIDLPHGVTTPGWFDLRSVADRLPWPDVRGKRCLDIGTYDGFLAFELERRGAAEVVATDIADHNLWDWPYALRREGPERLAQIAGEKGAGFEIAARALGSSVRKVEMSIYDLGPDTLGTFDVVVCGSLLLHLRDPVRALEAVRSVVSGSFLSSEQIDAELTLLHPRKPLTNLTGIGELVQWHVPNRAGHLKLVEAGGFRIVRRGAPYSVRFGPSHPPVGSGWRLQRRKAVTRAVTRDWGVAHNAVLAEPI
jgi:tRNA (mo5U34)-methyltransferase